MVIFLCYKCLILWNIYRAPATPRSLHKKYFSKFSKPAKPTQILFFVSIWKNNLLKIHETPGNLNFRLTLKIIYHWAVPSPCAYFFFQSKEKNKSNTRGLARVLWVCDKLFLQSHMKNNIRARFRRSVKDYFFKVKQIMTGTFSKKGRGFVTNYFSKSNEGSNPLEFWGSAEFWKILIMKSAEVGPNLELSRTLKARVHDSTMDF